VRGLVAVALTICLVSTLRAQDQERSLVNRLLKPDTTLQNTAQNKQFRADGHSIEKQATVASFYVEKKSKPETFTATKDFSANNFTSSSYSSGDQTNYAGGKQVQGVANYSTSAARQPGNVSSGNKSARSHDYTAQHPFLDRGKSQKSLNRQNPPMTVEQVRELLNKNK
jgi:hypothetical protein